MSESYEDVKVNRGCWEKLFSFIKFRIISEGLWINSDPEVWFKAITDPYTIIKEEMYMDTGGGRFHHNNIEIYNGYDYDCRTHPEPLFKCDLIYDYVWTYPTFSKRAADMYEYIQIYAKGETWFEKACSREYGLELDVKLWNKLFGPLEEIGKLTNKDLAKPKWNNKYILLLDIMSDLPKKGVHFSGQTSKKVQKYKQWALFALLDMDRFYWTSC